MPQLIPKYEVDHDANLDNPKATFTYTVIDTEDELEVHAAVENGVPAFWGSLVIQGYTINHVGGGVWEVKVTYGRLASSKFGNGTLPGNMTGSPSGQVGSPTNMPTGSISFDTGGGTQKMYQSLETLGRYGVRGVIEVQVINGGDGYFSAPAVNFNGGGGSGATATSAIDCRIAAVNIQDGGSSYTDPVTVDFVGGGGSGATATATTSGGQIVSVTVTNPGTGYTSAPTVTFSGGVGTGAVASVTFVRPVVSVTVVTPGTGYSATPTVAFNSQSGSGATAIAIIGAGSQNAIPDFKGAINVTGDQVEGVDAHLRKFEWSEVWHVPAALCTSSYRRALCRATYTTNRAMFRDFATGEVLFLGCSGSQRDLDRVELTFKFSASENESNITIGNIAGIYKPGWAYLWVRYETRVDNNARASVKVPKAVYVEKIYNDSDFSLLGIGN